MVNDHYTISFEELLREDHSPLSQNLLFGHRIIIMIFSPPFMKEIFVYNDKREEFFCPYARTIKMGKESLRGFGPIVWNTKTVKESPCLNIFKDCIKSWVPTSCKCRFCNDHNNDCLCSVCAD